jgi:FMN phosphatase YigB (HAD superfamily)
MIISAFDCDNTLLDLPYPAIDKYADYPDSITDYDLPLIKETHTAYLKAQEENHLIILLTNRCEAVKEELLEKLASYGLIFDIYSFRDHDRSKGNRLLEIAKKFPKIQQIYFYDDKRKHLKDVKQKLNEAGYEVENHRIKF